MLQEIEILANKTVNRVPIAGTGGVETICTAVWQTAVTAQLRV